jgi:hypothetical protein
MDVFGWPGALILFSLPTYLNLNGYSFRWAVPTDAPSFAEELPRPFGFGRERGFFCISHTERYRQLPCLQWHPCGRQCSHRGLRWAEAHGGTYATCRPSITLAAHIGLPRQHRCLCVLIVGELIDYFVGRNVLTKSHVRTPCGKKSMKGTRTSLTHK